MHSETFWTPDSLRVARFRANGNASRLFSAAIGEIDRAFLKLTVDRQPTEFAVRGCTGPGGESVTGLAVFRLDFNLIVSIL